MNAKMFPCLLLAMVISAPGAADDGWYRFPTELQGRWKIAAAETSGHTRDTYVGQIAEITGSTIVLRSTNGMNSYRLTFVDPGKSQIDLDLTATAPGGTQTKTFRCIMAVSPNQLRLCRPQNDQHSRPRDIESPDRSETLFTFIREAASPKP